MKIDTTTVYVFLDNFYQEFVKTEASYHLPGKKTTRVPGLSLSEILTILILYSFSPCKNFKFYYHTCITTHDFPNKVSYQRFIELIPRAFPLLCFLSQSLLKEPADGEYYMDSTHLAVCHNKRIFHHQVFDGLATRGKSSMGWFFGFKLHLIIDTKGDIMDIKFTPGNVDDRAVVDDMTVELIGKLYADRGYISAELFKKLWQRGLHLVTGIKKNMTNLPAHFYDKIMLRKRALIETVFGYLKNNFNIEHTRHRSPCNAFAHMISALIAYMMKPTKPTISTPYWIQG